MKIMDIDIRKVGDELRCLVTLADGTQMESSGPWKNPLGLWASPDDDRQHAEISAWLRNFARAIDDAAKTKDAA